ncbi:transposase family protein [Sinomicrobium kalidii]|uniref:transposase family protein n=1 Tax=Sinomicrobium kalidii TaxID=2900738 RepID=UPI001E5AA020|nr:transposase family protein [Sinomicrobium kalidii]UGU15181.1 transposase family protein [Sinomicrobium kalidii]
MYEYYNNILCVKASWLIKAGIVSENNYKNLTNRGWLQVIRRACRMTPALVAFDSMREDIRDKVVDKAGNPHKVASKNLLESYILPDKDATNFFAEHRRPNGKPLSTEKQKERVVNCMILNAVKTVLDKHTKSRALGGKTKAWQKISQVVNRLDPQKWPHALPGNPKSLQRRYKDYLQHGYASFIHRGEGNDNRLKITGEVADWLLAKYCLPNKPSIPIVLAGYNEIRLKKGWPVITESAVTHWLDKPEVKRIWVLARHGKEQWQKTYGHHLKRDRQNWFPNVYWAIDGSKLDWLHYADNTLGMAAKLKINPVVDVYSEKIIGWSYSETENHVDHIKAMKMAVNESQSRPYLLTYDNQSGHRMKRMQELYDNLVAREGGTHYRHQVGRKGNPIEQLFNRLQQQVINTLWFSDGQSVKARNEDNKPNMDFILSHREFLKTKEELIKAWEYCVQKWNNGEHPHFKGQTRNQVYDHETPVSESVDYSEMLNLFWVHETEPKKYYRGGMPLTVTGKKYEYEVYNADGKVDQEFRRKCVGAKLIVRYDPAMLNDYVQLYELTPEGEKIFVANAQPKRGHENIPILMEEGDKQRWYADFKVQDEEYERDAKAYRDLMVRTGVTPERLIEQQDLMIKMGGKLPKKERSEAEASSILSRL